MDHTGGKTPSSSSLQLDTDLRLHPQRLNLGKAELLTDAITLPFTDIDSRLGHYVLGATASEKRQLRISIKNYLGRLNSNPHIPLKFRIKVLNRFEQELDLFDAEMTAAVLNAHKIGLTLVQEAACHDDSYFPVLIDMIAHAIDLTIKLLRIDLEHYRPATIIVTRQFFELAKLGLEVSTALNTKNAIKTKHLQKAICNHECLRLLDFFNHDRIQQTIIWHELQYHIETIKAHFYRHGTELKHNNDVILLINLNRPHESAQVIRRTSNNPQPQIAPFDCIIMPLDIFIARLGKGIRSVKEVLSNQQLQHKALHTEDALTSTMIGGKAILLALKTTQRHHPRIAQSDSKIQLHENLSTSIINAFSINQENKKASEVDPDSLWNIVDVSPDGVCLERIHSGPVANYLGKMIGLNWFVGEHGESQLRMLLSKTTSAVLPALGFIRWVKEHKFGEQRIAIAFFHKQALAPQNSFQLAKAILLGGSNDAQEKCTWPILFQQNKTAIHAIFPEHNIYKNMTFMVLQGQQNQHFKVLRVLITGINYTRCEIIPAKTK